MQDAKAFNRVIKNLSGEQSIKEIEEFKKWRNESITNEDFYHKVKLLWDEPKKKETTFLRNFTFKKIKGFVFNQTIGNFIGFVVALSVTQLFSHSVLERKSIKNLFGLAGRKKVIVNDAPEWFQWTLSVVIGFIALEFVKYFFESKKPQAIYSFLKNQVIKQ